MSISFARYQAELGNAYQPSSAWQINEAELGSEQNKKIRLTAVSPPTASAPVGITNTYSSYWNWQDPQGSAIALRS